MNLSDIDPSLESIFSRHGVVAQGILESLPWEEIPSSNARRIFKARVYPEHLFWSILWRPNKVHWQRLGFSVSKPSEDWILTFSFTDPTRAAAALAASGAVHAEGEIPVPQGLGYFGYQKAGIEFLAGHRGALLADDPGLGKTIQVCGLLNRCPEIVRVLVICPASVKYVWARELEKWLTARERTIAVAPRFLAGDILIINYDLLHKLGKLANEWDLVVLDEAHYIKNPSALRSKAAKALAVRAGRKVLLTGTPIMNRPRELWGLLNVLDAKAWGPFFPFAKRYCDAFRGPFGWDFSGASNLDELNARLRTSGTFLRRTKEAVLPQLPRVMRQTIPLEADISPVLEHLCEELKKALGVEELPFEVDPLEIPFSLVSAIRHETGMLKVEAAQRFILESSSDSEKIVVFAHHKDVLCGLAAALAPHGGAVKVTGESSAKNRQRAIDDFQDDPKIKFFIASTTAMGVGVSLTAASRVIFVEPDWTPAVCEQAESRLHRIGQKGSVLAQYLVVHDSIDEKIMNAIASKMRIIKTVLRD